MVAAVLQHILSEEDHVSEMSVVAQLANQFEFINLYSGN